MPSTRTLPLADIDAPPTPMREVMDEQAMDELKESIRAIGLLSPIGVKQQGERYEIVFGHRRYVAHELLGRAEIEARVYAEDEPINEAAMLAENLCREDVSDFDMIIWLQELKEKHGYDEAALCKLVKRSPDWVADRFRLLRGDPEILTAMRGKQVSYAVARELNKIGEESMRRYYLDCAIRSTPPVRVVAQWVAEWRGSQAPAPAAANGEQPAAQHDAAAPVELACQCCGGAKDPYNLIHVTMHKWCWERIEQAMNAHAEA